MCKLILGQEIRPPIIPLKGDKEMTLLSQINVLHFVPLAGGLQGVINSICFHMVVLQPGMSGHKVSMIAPFSIYQASVDYYL